MYLTTNKLLLEKTSNCTNYDNTFIDDHHKHVFTGNMAIAGNKTLKDLLSEGLNFREPQPPEESIRVHNFCS